MYYIPVKKSFRYVNDCVRYVIVVFGVVYDHRMHFNTLLGISDMVCSKSSGDFCITLVNVFTPCLCVLHQFVTGIY